MKKRPRNFWTKFLDSGHSEGSGYKARNCSTNNFNKRCLSKQTYGGGSDRRGAARAAAAACEANIDTTYYTILRSTVWIIIINTHAKPLKSEHWKGPVETIRILWGKYYIGRQVGSQKRLALFFLKTILVGQIAHQAHLLPPGPAAQHKRH